MSRLDYVVSIRLDDLLQNFGVQLGSAGWDGNQHFENILRTINDGIKDVTLVIRHLTSLPRFDSEQSPAYSRKFESLMSIWINSRYVALNELTEESSINLPVICGT